MSWQCPYAIRLKCINNGLACKKIMKNGVDYNKTENALTIFCACQRFCKDVGCNINSDKAKECYDFHNQ